MANYALVLEGGGYRGAYTTGALDVLLEAGIHDIFTSVWGVSAGAMNASTYKAGMMGRTIRDILAYRDDPRFMSFASYLRTGNIAGNEFIYEEIFNEIDPFDTEAFNKSPMRMIAVASEATFGRAVYLPVETLPGDLNKIMASASIPSVSEIVKVDGHRLLDGGICDSVPLEAALGLTETPGVPDDWEYAEKALVILTRDRNYKKSAPNRVSRAAYQQNYSNYPDFEEQLANRYEYYNAQRERIWELEAEGKALVIAPKEPPAISMTETSGDKLLKLYVRGRQEMAEKLEDLRAFLA